MVEWKNSDYKLYDDPLKFYYKMLKDIGLAKKCIFLETYRFNNDSIGLRFKNALLEKAKQGVEIKILVDSWGTGSMVGFFKELVNNGVEVREYKKIKLFIDFFTKNHRRNHRKLLLIDHELSYIGSANITEYSLNWRESVLRIKGRLTRELEKVFFRDFENFQKYTLVRETNLKVFSDGGFYIYRDFPSIRQQNVMNKYLELIKAAKREIIIETPYFLPGFQLRRAMMQAASDGKRVLVLLPKHSDVRMIDILRSKYLGPMCKSGVKFMYYTGVNLHAKAILIDQLVFSIGSANFDYRSFRYQHEVILVGKKDVIAEQLYKHMQKTLEQCVEFNYNDWVHRPSIQKIFEWILLPLRHLL